MIIRYLRSLSELFKIFYRTRTFIRYSLSMPSFESGSHWAANMTWHLLTLAHHNARRQFCQMDPQTLHQTILLLLRHLHLQSTTTWICNSPILWCTHNFTQCQKKPDFWAIRWWLLHNCNYTQDIFNVSYKIKSEFLTFWLQFLPFAEKNQKLGLGKWKKTKIWF